MTACSKITVDIEEVHRLSEPVTFAKGAALAKTRSVRNICINGSSISALVEGSHTYQVQLNTEPYLSCYCTCPAAEYQPICKHAIALALCAGELDEQVESEREILRSYLAQMKQDELLDTLLDYLVADEAEWNNLLTKARLNRKGLSYRELKSMITKALPRCDIWSWRDIGSYFLDAERQLELIFEAVDALEVDLQWKLINYVVERLNLVLERIDDSYGERFGVEALVNEKMPAIFQRLDWSEEKKAEWMFKHLTSYEFDVFPSIEEHFESAWRDNTFYINLCRQAIEQYAPGGDSPWRLQTYAKPLIENAKDWQELADIKQKIAYQTRDYLGLCQLYLDNSEPLDAEYFLNKARKTASQFEMSGCDRMQVNLYLHLGEKSQAWRLVNKIFSDNPTIDEYRRVVDFKKQYQIDDEQFLVRTEQLFKDNYCEPDRLYIPRENSALVEFYIEIGEMEKACDWANSHKLNSEVLIELANQVIDKKPETTLEYYVRVVSATIEETNNDAYERAISHLQILESMLAGHPSTLEAFYEQIGLLAQTYKRKRNMQALFKEHYSDYL